MVSRSGDAETVQRMPTQTKSMKIWTEWVMLVICSVTWTRMAFAMMLTTVPRMPMPTKPIPMEMVSSRKRKLRKWQLNSKVVAAQVVAVAPAEEDAAAQEGAVAPEAAFPNGHPQNNDEHSS